MKKLLQLVVVMVMVLGFRVSAHATLTDNLDGTITQIREDGSKLMWLQDTNYAQTSGYDSDGIMIWDEAVKWAKNLEYAGYQDWRLPATLPVSGSTYDLNLSYDGSTDRGHNIISPSAELSYMYYVELGYLGWRYTDGSGPQPGWGFTNDTGPFTNFQLMPDHPTASNYWYGTEKPLDTTNSFNFDFGSGHQWTGGKVNSYYAWAVRPVPEPSTILLLGSGLVGLVAMRKFKANIS